MSWFVCSCLLLAIWLMGEGTHPIATSQCDIPSMIMSCESDVITLGMLCSDTLVFGQNLVWAHRVSSQNQSSGLWHQSNEKAAHETLSHPQLSENSLPFLVHARIPPGYPSINSLLPYLLPFSYCPLHADHDWRCSLCLKNLQLNSIYDWGAFLLIWLESTWVNWRGKTISHTYKKLKFWNRNICNTYCPIKPEQMYCFNHKHAQFIIYLFIYIIYLTYLWNLKIMS